MKKLTNKQFKPLKTATEKAYYKKLYGKKYNLDMESYFIEFQQKLLSE